MRIIVVGDTGVKDAVIAAPFTDARTPILFVKRDTIPDSVAAEITRLDPTEILVFGGTVRVSDMVVRALEQFAPVVRIAGSSVFATAVAASQDLFPPEPPSAVLWNGDTETGDVSQWDGVSISGRAAVEVVAAPVHSGNYALKLVNWDVDGTHPAGVRMRVEKLGPDPKNLPDDAVYSAWYLVPFAFEGRSAIFQFKQADVDRFDSQGIPSHQTRRMLSAVFMNWNGAGYDLEYKTRIDQSTGGWRSGPSDKLFTADTNIPVGEWFHVEMRYVWNDQGRGRSTLWLNGTQVWDLTDISTEANNLTYIQQPRQWTVNHYLGDWQGYVAPGDSWIFVDDAQIVAV